MAHSPLVLWGPPGIGKTHAARERAQAHGGTVVWWTPEDRAEAPSGALVVADGFGEVPAVPEGVALVVTSRRRLRGPGVLDEEVLPLGLARASALLRARTGGWPESQDVAVRRLLEELDGLPLALELAAGAWDVLGPEGLVARLDRLSTVLVDPGRERAEHRSLAGALDAGLAELGAEEQQALAELAVFRGLFSVDDAARVLGREVVAEVEALRDRGLIRSQGPGRLQVLRPIQRHVWAQRGVRDTVTAHRRWVLDTASGRDPEDVRPALEATLEAGDRAGTLVLLDALRSHSPPTAELLGWTERALAAQGATVSLLARVGRLRMLSGRLDTARDALELARAQASDPAEQADVLHDLGALGTELADRALAVSSFEGAVKLLEKQRQRVKAATARGELAMVHLHFGDVDAAEREVERALTVLEAGRSPYLHAHMLANRSMIWLTRGNAANARLDLADAQERLGTRAHAYGQGYVAACRGLVELVSGRPEAAGRALRSALGHVEGHGFGLLELRIRVRLVGVLGWLGEEREHRTQLRAARRLLAQGGDSTVAGVLALYEALACLECGDANAASERMRGAAGELARPELLGLDEEARMVRALIERRLPALEVAVLRVSDDAGSVRVPGEVTVDLGRHEAARRMVLALVEGWEAGEGWVSREALFAAGWPGVDIAPDSAGARVRTELSRLRRLGLREVIESGREGVRLVGVVVRG